LEGGPPGFTQGSTSLALLRNSSSTGSRFFGLQGCHLLWLAFPSHSTRNARHLGGSCNPGSRSRRFGLVRFRSPLLTESLLISFPPGTEMFQFPGLASQDYAFILG
jgi:hypothetical protein